MSAWQRSSFCAVGSCLEVRTLPSGAVQLRSTVTGERITALSTEWEAFLAGVRAGEFDHHGQPGGGR